MSRSAVDADASRAVTAEMAAASLSAGSAPAAASIATSPVIVSVKVRHGGATRISSGRRRATKLMARPIL